jgi:hypothetical protein
LATTQTSPAVRIGRHPSGRQPGSGGVPLSGERSGADDVSEGGGSIEGRVTANEGCGWTASSSVGWLAGVRTAGTGSGVAAFVAEPNQGPRRSGVITVAGQSFPVTQRAAGSAAPTPALKSLISDKFTSSQLNHPRVILTTQNHL